MSRHLAWTVLALGALACCSQDAASDRPRMPKPRGGVELVGQEFGEPAFSRWIGPKLSLGGVATGGPKAVLLRWWTDGCPFCEASLPAFDALRRRFEPLGLATVAVYHPKPPRAIEDATIVAAAAERGYHGAIAVDIEWSVLESTWPQVLGREATSVSLLVDGAGLIRFAHPGPEFHPADPTRSGPEHAQCEEDFRALERALSVLLGA